MPRDIPQVSFGGGVISKKAYGRVDLQKFGSAVKQADNYLVIAEGGISNRMGTKFIKEVKDSSDTVRMIEFEFNESQAYALEFGDQYMRIFSSGAVVLEADQTITGITAANPAVVTIAGHPFLDGEQIYIATVVGMTEVNGKFYTVANKATNTFELSGVDSSAYTAYGSAGTAARVYTLTTPYLNTELAELKFRQSNDVIYMGHINHSPRKLSRTSATVWTLEEVDFQPEQAFPANCTAAAEGTTGSTVYEYKVTAVAEETGEESLIGTGTNHTITGATQANPVVLTVTAHPFADGEEIHVSGIVGMTELNGRRFTIANQATNTIELEGEDGTSHTAYSSGGDADRTVVRCTDGNATLSSTNFPRITIPATTGAEKYNVYKEDNGLYGFIGSTETTTFDDTNIEADLEDTAPKWRQLFSTTGNYPEAVGLHEQRSWWGNTTNKPLTAFSSQTGQFENLNTSSPTRATDAITLRLVTGKGNEIRHFRSFRDRLFTFTSGAVWTIGPGGTTDGITPSSKKVDLQEYLPATQVPPLTIKNNLLMVAGKANQGYEVHSIGEDINSGVAGKYTGSDLTVLARHLFEQHTILEWCYLERPHRIILGVRDDGKIVCMTYLAEHQIFAWTLWDTEGTVESICSVPEGQIDTAYLVIKRTIDGSDVKYVERLEERYFSAIEDAWFVDSGLSIDNTNATTISGATQADPVVLTITGHPYSNGDIIYVSDIAGTTELNEREFTVANVAANTVELSGEDGSAHTAYTSGGSAQLMTKTISGLDHLEGRTDVIAQYDGNIEDALTVTSGSVTLGNAFVKCIIGLPYTGTIESLPINGMPEVIAKKKTVNALMVRITDTRGIKAGTSADDLGEFPARENELWGEPAAMISDLIRIPVSGDWDRDTSVIIQSEPGLPQTILSMIPDVTVGGS